ncbi:hypothetical protein LEP1GSC021_3746 [Leptospira noguchii str. 1993005606]|nr:hypothetical protein LEP1GSC021_3746 [Leptospira noguchii str. 1993005606]
MKWTIKAVLRISTVEFFNNSILYFVKYKFMILFFVSKVS